MAKSGSSSSRERRLREKEGHRALIFAAALELFAEKGYHDTGMSEIAERAGFATGSLYNFFKSKDEIYESIIQETHGRIVSSLLEVLDSRADALKVLAEYVGSGARLASESLPILKLAIATHMTVAGLGARIRERVRERDALLEKRLAAVMKRGMREGVIRRGDPAFLAVSFSEFLRACFIREIEDTHRPVAPGFARDLYDLFMKGASASRS